MRWLAVLAPVTAILLYVWFERVNYLDERMNAEALKFEKAAAEFDAAFYKRIGNEEKAREFENTAKKLSEEIDSAKKSIAASKETEKKNAEELKAAIELQAQKNNE